MTTTENTASLDNYMLDAEREFTALVLEGDFVAAEALYFHGEWPETTLYPSDFTVADLAAYDEDEAIAEIMVGEWEAPFAAPRPF
jgi:hypothetical protein